MKSIISAMLETSFLWNLPVSAALSFIAASEGIKGGFPVKTVIACASYAIFFAVLVALKYLIQ